MLCSFIKSLGDDQICSAWYSYLWYVVCICVYVNIRSKMLKVCIKDCFFGVYIYVLWVFDFKDRSYYRKFYFVFKIKKKGEV